MMKSGLVAAALLAIGAQQSFAQSLSSRIAASGDATVRFAFASRDGVCGDGRQMYGEESEDGGWFNVYSSGGSFYSDGGDGWRRVCLPGPVRVTLTLSAGKPQTVRTAVGPESRSVTGVDLGLVGAKEAVDYLLGVSRQLDSRSGNDAIYAAAFADSVTIAPRLLDLARADDVPKRTRDTAIFWLARTVGRLATAGLPRRLGDDDYDVRKQAVFALSQLPRHEGVPELINVARSHRDPRLRRDAIFWLGDSKDPRALDFFGEMVRGR